MHQKVFSENMEESICPGLVKEGYACYGPDFVVLARPGMSWMPRVKRLKTAGVYLIGEHNSLSRPQIRLF